MKDTKQKIWHKITHILTGFLNNNLEIIRMEKSPKEYIIVYFRCKKCGKRENYKWNWSIEL